MKRRRFTRFLPGISAALLIEMSPFKRLKAMDPNYIHQMSLGDIKCTLLYDMDFVYRGQDFFRNVDEEILVKELIEYGQTLDRIPSPYIGLLLEYESNKILIDTGVGYMEQGQEINGQQFKLEGRLQKLLRRVGVDGWDLTHLILTHFHPDHIGGVYSSDGQLLYPNAKIYAHADEWEYWMGGKSSQQPSIFRYFINENIAPLKDENIYLVGMDDEEIAEGVRLIKTSGHTPGHLSVALQSQGEQLLYISDTWLHPLHIRHVDWETVYDLDQDLAHKSRIFMLEEAYKNNMTVQSFHFPFPGLGHVDKVKDGWTWVPK